MLLIMDIYSFCLRLSQIISKEGFQLVFLFEFIPLLELKELIAHILS